MTDQILLLRRMAYPVESLGPGQRLSLWVSGCMKGCRGCIAPELQKSKKSDSMEIEKITSVISELSETQGLSRLTISGGEPLLQFEAIMAVCECARQHGINDIIMFTGYDADELDAMLDKAELQRLSENVDVLVTGEYKDELNDPNDQYARIRGSTNQDVIFFTKNNALKHEYIDYCRTGRQLQVMNNNGNIYLFGIPNKIKEE